MDSSQLHPRDNTGLSKDQMIVILTVICLFLAFIIITFIGWLLWRSCFRQRYQRWRSQRNPEQQRAEQLLNPPMQSIDLEIGVIHARSPPHWPLTDAAEMQITTPSDYDEVTRYMQSGTSMYYDAYSNRTETTPSEAVYPCVSFDGLDIADAPLSNINDTANVVEEMALTNPDNPDLKPEPMHLFGGFTNTEQEEEDTTDRAPQQRPDSEIPTRGELEAGSTCFETSGTRLDSSQVIGKATIGDETQVRIHAQDSSDEQYWAYYAY